MSDELQLQIYRYLFPPFLAWQIFNRIVVRSFEWDFQTGQHHQLSGSLEELRGIWKGIILQTICAHFNPYGNPQGYSETTHGRPWVDHWWQHSSTVKAKTKYYGWPIVFPMDPNAHRSTHSPPLSSHTGWYAHRQSTVPSKLPLMTVLAPSQVNQSILQVKVCMGHPQYYISPLLGQPLG